MRTHVTGAISHGDGRIFSFIDLMRWPHDSNLTSNVLLQIFVELSEVPKLSDQLSLKTDDFVFIEHVKIDNPGSYFYNMFHPANRVASNFPDLSSKDRSDSIC